MNTHILKYAFSILRSGRPLLPEGIHIGKNVLIDATARLDYLYGKHITICDDVIIGDGARILCHDLSSIRRIGVIWVAPVYIGERAFVGADSLILPGVTIGKDAVVAAGAVVSENVDPGVIVAGVPAKPIGSAYELDKKRIKMMGTKKYYDSKLIYGEKKGATELNINDEQINSANKDGGYFIVFKKDIDENKTSDASK